MAEVRSPSDCRLRKLCLYIRYGINKKIVPYFFQNPSIVLQTTVTYLHKRIQHPTVLGCRTCLRALFIDAQLVNFGPVFWIVRRAKAVTVWAPRLKVWRGRGLVGDICAMPVPRFLATHHHASRQNEVQFLQYQFLHLPRRKNQTRRLQNHERGQRDIR